MMRRTMLLAAAVLALAGCATGMRGAGSVPMEFIGTWDGTGVQSDRPGEEWTIKAIIVGGPMEQVGTITYPSLDCGGVLLLRSAGADGLELREDITRGVCVDQGILTLTTMSDGRLRYKWKTDAYGITAWGTLTRVK